MDRRKTFGTSLKEYERRKTVPDNAKTGGRSSTEDSAEVIRIDTELIITDVLVTDGKGSIVAGLGKEDFIVSEDAIVQQISLFAPAASNKLPKRIVLIAERNNTAQAHRNNLDAIRSLIDWL